MGSHYNFHFFMFCIYGDCQNNFPNIHTASGNNQKQHSPSIWTLESNGSQYPNPD